MQEARTINVVIAGLGGQGVLRATDILADAAFRAGLDVKKSEIRGMSQRGGSVASDVRFGEDILSPMVPAGEADFLVVLDSTQVDANRACLRGGGAILTPDLVSQSALPDPRCLNIALLGLLSARLEIPLDAWRAAIRAHLPERARDMGLKAFDLGRASKR